MIKIADTGFKENLVFVSIDKAANNVAFICKHIYALTIIKELNIDCHLSNQEDNKTYTFINNETNDQRIKEHKFYLSKQKINLTNNMQDLTDFAFKGGTRDYVTVSNSEVF